MSKESHYLKRYGSGSGFSGFVPDFSRCCHEVRPSHAWHRGNQCARPCGHGPDGAYCRQHDPAVAAARRKASDEAGKRRFNERRCGFYGPQFLAALEEIANGHRDPAGLAKQVVARFRSGEMT